MSNAAYIFVQKKEFYGTFILPFLLALCLFSSLSAQVWNTNLNAAYLGNGFYRLTNGANQRGSIWAPDSLDLAQDFDLTYSVIQYHPTGGLAGDGIAFVMQRSVAGIAATGGGGNGLGYATSNPASFPGITPSLAVELDIWGNGAPIDDIPQHHVAVHENGNIFLPPGAIMGPAFANGGAAIGDSVCRPLRIVWDASLTQLEIFFNGVSVLSGIYDIPNNTFGGNTKVIYGFTGSAGASPGVQVIGMAQLTVQADTSTCRNTSLFLPASGGFSGIYTWSNMTSGGITGLSCGVCANPVFTPYGGLPLVQYQVTTTDSIGCVWRDSVAITINPIPIADAGPDLVICEGDSIQIGTVSASPNYTFSWATPIGLDNTNLAQPMASPPFSSNYSVTVVDTSTPNMCQATDDMVLTVNPNPVAAAGPDDTICLGDSSQLGGIAQAGLIYSWNPIANLDNGSISDPMATPPATVQYILAVENSLTGCSDTDSVVVTVLNLPPAAAGNDTSICQNSLQLNGSPVPNSGIGNWVVLMGGGAVNPANSPSGIVNLLSQGNNQLSWQITDSLGCVGTDTMLIQVNIPAQALAGADTTICGDSVLLNAQPVAFGTGNWSGNGPMINPVNSPNATASGIPPGFNEFYWISSNLNCADTDTVVVQAFQLIQANAGADTGICGSQFTLAGSNAAPGTGLWSGLSGPGVIANPNLPNSQLSNLSGTPTQLSWVVTYGPCSSADTVLITGANLVPALAGTDTSICGDTCQLNAQAPAMGNGSWVSNGPALNPANQAQTTASNIPAGMNEFYWITNNLGCSDTDTVVVSAFALVMAAAGPDTVTCGSLINLSGSNPAPGTGNWTVLFGPGLVSNPSSPSSQVSNLSPTPTFLSWVVTNGPCTDADSVEILGLNLVSAQAGPDTSICGDSLQLGAVPNGPGSTGMWTLGSPGAGNFDDDTLPGAIVYNLDTGFNALVWTVTNGTCAESDTLLVHTDEMPTANAGPDQTNLSNDQTSMNAVTPLIGSGIWSLVSGGGLIQNPNSPTSQIDNLPNGSSVFAWTVTNGICPSAQDQVILTYLEPIDTMPNTLFIPEGFSPNNDGTNEYFAIRGIENLPGCKLSIFNRWGNLVNAFDNYQNQWKGENPVGDPLVDDTYFIVLKLPDGELRKGYVVIKR
ncbi:MAG: gliding motility-associated C-terminal domain-containing protein [Bacteroidia bacterium]|nr:gliding motility-associated C-terminal domain-containing protein [Bacteroidia bacterium]